MKIKQKNLFHLLMVFREVIRQGSFTAAAEKLDLTKSVKLTLHTWGLTPKYV